MNVLQNQKTRVLILLMITLVFFSLVFAHFHYKKINASVDPRVVKARKMYELYNHYAEANYLDSVIFLMDTIEEIYKGIPAYKNSFEIGVLYNNRAAAFLTMALFSSQIDSLAKDSLIELAEKESLTSIDIYTNWLKRFENLSSGEIEQGIKEEFTEGIQTDNKKQIINFLENRVKEIEEAQLESGRRLSVSYTNLGIVYRHREEYEKAAGMYIKALEFWEDNLTAENNLNILLGRPLKKRTLLQKLFPPEKN
ncbi:MAG: tetratricopeptide repeat protein [Bacteroidales bacterium]|nr:tetratricopeptide repeat protein [Bacteroidales bacterium]MBN2819730.1 tetratricopeptide repeat protein [Bacteroidales bacterium]